MTTPFHQRIANSLDQAAGIDESAMRLLAEEYDDQVRRLNRRLEDTTSLLRQGLRSEAIRLAEGPPSLIDAAVLLDTPRFEEWTEVLLFLGIPAPPAIDQDAVDAVSDAMVEVQPIEDLLKRQRQMVLAHASLAARLPILRAIRDRDPASAQWSEDLDAWEKVRCQQLQQEIPAAISSGNADEIRRLAAEVQADRWDTPPPPSLIESIQAAEREIQFRGVFADLGKAATQISQAYERFDESATRDAAGRYRAANAKLVSIAAPAPPPPLPSDIADLAQAGLQWVNDLDAEAERVQQRGAAWAGLETAIETAYQERRIAPLETAYQKAAAFGDPIPDELLSRYRTSTRELRLVATRRYVLGLTSAVLFALLIAVGTFFWRRSVNRNARIDLVKTKLTSMLDAEQLETAANFIKDVRDKDPDTLGHPDVASLVSRHAAMLETETLRAERFQVDLQALKIQADSELDPGDVAALESAARLESEKSAVYAIQRRLGAYQSKQMRAHNERLLSGLSPLQKRLDAIRKSTTGTALQAAQYTTLADESESLVTDMKGLIRTNDQAGTDAKQTVESQIRRARDLAMNLRNAAAGQSVLDRAMAEVMGAKDRDALYLAMQQYINTDERNATSIAFREALQARPLQETAELWNEFVDSTANLLSPPYPPEEFDKARQLHSRLREKCASFPGSIPPPVADVLRDYKLREETLNECIKGIQAMPMGQLISLFEKAGNRYFMYETFFQRKKGDFPLDPNGSARIVRGDVVHKTDGAVERKSLRGPFRMTREPRESVDVTLAYIKANRDKFLVDWEDRFSRAIIALRKRSRLEPAIREILTQRLLAAAAKADKRLSNRVKTAIDALERESSKHQVWYEPRDPNVEMANNVLVQAVYPPLQQAYKERRDIAGGVNQLKKMRVVPAGWLKSEQGKHAAIWWQDASNVDGFVLSVKRDQKDPNLAAWVVVAKKEGPTLRWSPQADQVGTGGILYFQSASAGKAKASADARKKSQVPFAGNRPGPSVASHKRYLVALHKKNVGASHTTYLTLFSRFP
ncbi:MAG: hypothetical protein AAF958_01195 [Planctomycetota bacterium]